MSKVKGHVELSSWMRFLVDEIAFQRLRDIMMFNVSYELESSNYMESPSAVSKEGYRYSVARGLFRSREFHLLFLLQ